MALYAYGREPKIPGPDWRGPTVGAAAFFSAQEEAGYGHGGGFGH